MLRSRFHQHVSREWPMPRSVGQSFVYNFDSDRYLVVILFLGTHYELDWWGHSDLDPTEEVGMLDTGTIAFVCEEAEAFMRQTLEEEGKDPEGCC